MTVTLALAGDTMLGRKVGERLSHSPPPPLLSPEVAALVGGADLFVCNLECCISERGQPWPDPGKPFFFRAPPVAADVLADLGVDAVTLANNHALDYGEQALLDTLAHLAEVGIAVVGAGPDLEQARRPVVLGADGLRVGLVAAADHPASFAAGADRPGIAYADLLEGVPEWLAQTVADLDADVVVVSPHWGPNMVAEPVAHVRGAAPLLVEAGATLVAGHSAHVFHGVEVQRQAAVLYDLGDFVDDYAVHPERRNDLGLLWLVEFDGANPARLEAVPLRLDYCFTDLAGGQDAAWVRERFRSACAEFGTDVVERDGRLTVDLSR